MNKSIAPLCIVCTYLSVPVKDCILGNCSNHAFFGAQSYVFARPRSWLFGLSSAISWPFYGTSLGFQGNASVTFSHDITRDFSPHNCTLPHLISRPIVIIITKKKNKKKNGKPKKQAPAACLTDLLQCCKCNRKILDIISNEKSGLSDGNLSKWLVVADARTNEKSYQLQVLRQYFQKMNSNNDKLDTIRSFLLRFLNRNFWNANNSEKIWAGQHNLAKYTYSGCLDH